MRFIHCWQTFRFHCFLQCPLSPIASRWDFPFADSKVAILPDFGPISKPNDHADGNCLCLNAKLDPFPLIRVQRRALFRCAAQHQPTHSRVCHDSSPNATLNHVAATAAARRTAGCAPGSLQTTHAAPRRQPSETLRTWNVHFSNRRVREGGLSIGSKCEEGGGCGIPKRHRSV